MIRTKERIPDRKKYNKEIKRKKKRMRITTEYREEETETKVSNVSEKRG